jgi:glutaminase
MAVMSEETAVVGSDKVHALVQLLRTRSYEEIRQRMYDNPPGSPWWSACKIELDIRNGEQIAAALSATSHVLEKLRGSTQHFEQLAETLHESTKEVLDMLAGTKEAGRRLEIAVYVTIGITLVQLFNLIFEVFRKR